MIEESGGILNEIAITKEGHWDKNFKKPAPTPILIKCTFCDNVGHTEAVCKSKRKVQELTNDSFNLSNKYKRRVESIVISDDDEKQSNTNNLPGKFKNQVVGRSTKVSKVASGRKKVSAPGEICIKWNKKKCNGGCQRIHVCLICFSADHGKDDCNKTVIS